MNIQSKLRIGTTVITTLMLVFIVTMFFFLSFIRDVYEKQKIAGKITENSFQLSLLLSEYTRYPSARPKAQWINVYESQARLLDENAPLFGRPEEKMLIDEIVSLSVIRKQLFEDLVRNTESGGSETVIRELGNQLSVKAQTVTSDAQRLAELSRQESTHAGWVFALAAVLLGSLVIGMTAGFSLMSRKIAESIRTLGEGTKIIAGGDLSHRLEARSHDEIGELATLFNQMAVRLQESHATLEKKVEERTKEISTMLNALDNVALVSMTDAKGDIVYANDKFVEVSKYTREELIGQNHRILKSGKQPQTLFIELWKTISNGGVWRGEILNRSKDGTEHWVDTSIAPVLGSNGKPERYISVRFLITERKNALREIQKFQEAVEASTDAIAITLPNLEYTYVNPTWKRLTGYANREVLGQTPRLMLSKKMDPHIAQQLLNIAHEKGEEEEEEEEEVTLHSDQFIYKRKDGSEYNAEIAVYPIRESGKIAFYVLVHRDITQRKRSDLSKTEFVSLASHQLRTPLSVLRLVIDSLLRGIKGPLRPDQQSLVLGAKEYAKRMAETINTLLSVSLSDEGKIQLSISDALLADILKSVENECREEFLQKNIQCSIMCQPRLTLRTDRKLLTEVITNLMANAIRYTPNGGNITVRGERKAESVMIQIQDTGIGIPQNDKGNIFTKFFRAENAMEVCSDGSGLGLYLAHSFVTMLGGTISVQSEEGKGSTFTIVLSTSPPTHEARPDR